MPFTGNFFDIQVFIKGFNEPLYLLLSKLCVLNDKYMIQSDDRFTTNNKKFLSSVFSDEMMFMNLETGNYLGLNPVSSDIYKLAEEDATAEEIIKNLLEKYDVEEEICRTQVMTCINDMLDKEMLIKI